RGGPPQVVRTGPWDSLRDVVLVARRLALADETPEELRRSALDLIARLEQQDSIAALVESARALGSLTPELEALLAAGGADSILAIARAIRGRRGEAVAEELAALTVRLGDGCWQQVIARAQEWPFEDVSALLPLLGRLPVENARGLGYALLEHPDSRVRTRVLAFLINASPKDACWSQLLEWALVHPDPQMANVARAALINIRPTNERLVALALSEKGPCPVEGRLRGQLEALQSTIDQERPTPSEPEEKES
ncbi:MAG: hypothetical protein Q9Q13_07345, partial [Acidobacteriota bacterium]|nr:hypothetical protein [Acidobacteriota bacterium]